MWEAGRGGGMGWEEAKAPQVKTRGPELSTDGPDLTTRPKDIIPVKGRIPDR